MAASGMTQSVAYFESLGGDAEFAVVQRRCGVRAAGVLAHARHGGIAVLIRLLDAGFAGLFDHGNLSLTDQDELHDQHYDVRMPRAVAAPGAAPAPASDAALLHLLLRAEAEVQGRAAATLARLTAGGTIFVLKATTPPDAEAVRALLASLRRFGDNALLLVRPGSAPLVARAEPNVYTGNMTAFAYGADVLEGIRVAEWEALCRATLRLHAPPRPAAPAPLPVPPPRPDTVAPLANAVRLHRDGNLDAAGAAYQALLNANPGHADALHLLGLVRDAQGQAEQALALIAKAIARKSSPRFFANQGVILGRIGRLDDAVAAHRQALALQPDYPEALNNLGMRKPGSTSAMPSACSATCRARRRRSGRRSRRSRRSPLPRCPPARENCSASRPTAACRARSIAARIWRKPRPSPDGRRAGCRSPRCGRAICMACTRCWSGAAN